MSQQPPEWPSNSPQDPGQDPPGWGQGQEQPPPPPPGPPYGAPPGGEEPYSAPGAIGYAWKAFTGNPWPFVAVGLLWVVSQIGISSIGSVLGSDSDTVGFGAGLSVIGLVFNILAGLVAALFVAAAVRGALDVVEGTPVTFGGMFERWDKVQVIIAALVLNVAISIGLVLCVLPGLVIIFLTWFTTFFIVGAGLGAFDAIAASFRFTTANFGNLIVLALLNVLVMIAGIIACLVGLFVAYPVVLLAGAYTFRRLHGQPVAP